ncbi:hypothetical protein LTR16_007762, partial [Cryomyces antarcticus]
MSDLFIDDYSLVKSNMTLCGMQMAVPDLRDAFVKRRWNGLDQNPMTVERLLHEILSGLDCQNSPANAVT